MFGIPGFVIGFGFANCYLIIAIGIFIFARIRKRKTPWKQLIPLLLFQVIGSSLLLPRYYHQAANFIFLKTVNPAEVVSIQVDTVEWTTPDDIEIIIETLNQAIWHETAHDVGGPFVTMTITLQSGKVWKAHVGRYYDKDGAMFEFFHLANQFRGYWHDGTTYVPQLMTTFENLGYSLPVSP